MGEVQSAQREGRKDAAAAAAEEEEGGGGGGGGQVEDAQAEQQQQQQQPDDKPLKSKGQISELNGKADGSLLEVNGHCEEEMAAEAIISQGEAVPEKPLDEEETPLENISIIEKESPTEADADVDEEESLDMKKMEAKQNDINESFKTFFNKIGLKLTVKRGSIDVETNRGDSRRASEVKDTAKESKTEAAEQIADLNVPQESNDNDSTTCPTLTDVTSEDVLETAEEKAKEAKEADAAEIADTAGEDGKIEQEQEPTSDDEEVSPIKKFFTTGIFAGLRKKKKSIEDEAVEKELVDMGRKAAEEAASETKQDQQQDKDETSPGGATPQEKDKVEASPLKKLLAGSSSKKRSKKQKSRSSSDAKLSDSGEQVSDQLLSSTESAGNQRVKGLTQSAVEAVEEEDSPWTSFKKLMTPRKHSKRPSLTTEEAQIPAEEAKTAVGEQISDHSTEESKKRKESSVSWEAVLCGSGKRRSRKTSDSEDEAPQAVNDKQVDESKHGAESPIESSVEAEEILASSPKQTESQSDGDGESTWKSFKRLVTPKRKAKDEEESKSNVQSDTEVTPDESSFSVKKLLPGRKKRKSAERPDQVSSDEADKDVASEDEDDTPQVIPLSEFDTAETEVESPELLDEGKEVHEDLIDQTAEAAEPSDDLQSEEKEVQDLVEEATTNEEEDVTESVSKHQQLSDIPEEGVITETMVTPASVTEVARDDTIAEDLVEITSEAVTAPEPVDTTVTDETEMISAVSELSESSKTSGNTTPVPAEYEIKEEEALLQQVVETLSTMPKAIPVCSGEPKPETVVGSISRQILEGHDVMHEPTVLEIHRVSDATSFHTGINVQELEAIANLAATAQTQSIAEVNEAVSTESVSEIATEEFDTAEIGLDEVHEAEVTHQEETIKELESIDDSQPSVESLTEAAETVSEEGLPGSSESKDEEEIVSPQEESMITSVHETEASEAMTAETLPESKESMTEEATVEAETEVEPVEQEEKSLETENDGAQSVTDQVEVEDGPASVVEESEETPVDAAQKESVEPAEDEGAPEDIPAESVTDDIKEETVAPTEGTTGADVVHTETDAETDVVHAETDVVHAETDVVHTETDAETDVVHAETDVVHAETDVVQTETDVVQTETDAETDVAHAETDVVCAETDLVHPEAGADTDVVCAETDVVCPEAGAEIDVVQLETDVVCPEAGAEIDVVQLETDVVCPEAGAEIDVVQLETDVVCPEAGAEIDVVQLETDVVCPEAGAETEDAELEEQSVAADVEKETVQSLDMKETSAQDPEVGTLAAEQAPSLEQVEIPESLPAEEDELKEESDANVEPVEPPAEPATTEQVQEPELLPCYAQDTVTEAVTETVTVPAVTEPAAEGSAPELQIEDQAAETKQDQEKEEELPQDALLEPDDDLPEAVEELEPVVAVHVSTVDEETNGVQELEKPIISEETPETATDVAEVVAEPQHEVHLGETQVDVEGEKEGELPGAEVKMAAVEDGGTAQVTVCDLPDAIPDVLTEQTLDKEEAAIEIVATALEVNETVETTKPLEEDAAPETAKLDDEVMMMHVPALKSDYMHNIQVQVVDVDMKSVEAVVETVLEVGVTQAKDHVIDVCHETLEKVDPISATEEVEEELMKQENNVTIQEVVQRVQETPPETLPDSVTLQPVAQEEVDNLVATIVKESLAATAESKVSEVDNQTVTEDVAEAPEEVPDKGLTMSSAEIKTEQEVSEEVAETPKETKAEVEQPEVCVKTEEVPKEKVNEDILEAAQIVQKQIVVPGDTGLIVPQNTGIISSQGNVESPSSLSLEFKLNIQFGQTRAPTSPPPTPERAEPKHTEVSEVGIQAVVEPVEPAEPVEPTNTAESTQTEPTESTPEAEQETKLDPPETTASMSPTVTMDIGIQAMEAVEAVEEVSVTESVTPNVQATKTIQPVRKTEKRQVIQRQKVQTRAEKAVKDTEDEGDQDIWMDAEEDISTQEETEGSCLEESLKTVSDQDEKDVAEDDFEVAPPSEPEAAESQPELPKTEGTCDVESEVEVFAVALEDTTVANGATIEWD